MILVCDWPSFHPVPDILSPIATPFDLTEIIPERFARVGIAEIETAEQYCICLAAVSAFAIVLLPTIQQSTEAAVSERREHDNNTAAQGLHFDTLNGLKDAISALVAARWVRGCHIRAQCCRNGNIHPPEVSQPPPELQDDPDGDIDMPLTCPST